MIGLPRPWQSRGKRAKEVSSSKGKMTAGDGRADCVRTAEAETLQMYTTSTLRQTKGAIMT